MNPPTLHITEQLLTHLGPRYQFSLKGYISTGRLLVFLLLISSAIGARPEWTQVETMTRCNLCLASARIPRKEGDPCFLHVRQLRTRARSGGTTFEGMSTRLRRYRRDIAAGAKNRDVEAKPSSQSFYERLKSPKHILAPMVAQSDLPFRLMCEQLFNVDLSYTQMIHGSNFVEDNGEIFRANHLDVFPQSTVKAILLGESDLGELCVTPSQVNALKGLSGDEVENSRGRLLAAIDRRKGTGMLSEESLQIKPTFVQIAASCPDTAVKAAMMILEKSGTTESYRCGTAPPVMAIDLNLGCPQSIARKGTYGSFLHDESPDLTYQVLSNLRAKLPPEVGVTAKIRLPPTQADADAGKLGNMSQTKAPQSINERIRCLIDCGVDLITVHGRTRFENKVAVGAADWGAVRQCVETARSYSGDAHYPVFANGGIEFGDDVTNCFETTNASGVMSSESLLEMPSLFSTEGETSSSMTAMQLLERQIGFADIYLDYATLFPPVPGSLGTRGGSFNVIRSHLFKFLHRYLEENPDLRSSLGDQQLHTIKDARSLVSDLRSRYDNVGEEQLRLKKSFGVDSSWYRRHRRQSVPQQDLTTSLSLDEKKRLAKLRIRQMREDRMRRSIISR